jgi:hypothetical protein
VFQGCNSTHCIWDVAFLSDFTVPVAKRAAHEALFGALCLTATLATLSGMFAVMFVHWLVALTMYLFWCYLLLVSWF